MGRLGFDNIRNWGDLAPQLFKILWPLALFGFMIYFIRSIMIYNIRVNIRGKVGGLGEKGLARFERARIVNDKHKGIVYLQLKRKKTQLPMPPRTCFVPVRGLFAKWMLDLEQINELDYVAMEPPNLKHPNNYKEIDLRMLQWYIAQGKSTRFI